MCIVDNNWNYGCGLSQWGECWNTHFGFNWNCEGGDKEQIVIKTDNIVYDGDGLQFKIWQNENGEDDGYLHIWEMGPDFFRTPHTSEQIQVLVNDYPAWCSSTGM